MVIELWTALCTARPGQPAAAACRVRRSRPPPVDRRNIGRCLRCGPVGPTSGQSRGPDDRTGRRPAVGSRTGRSSGSPSPPSARWSPSRCSCSPTPPSSGTSAPRSWPGSASPARCWPPSVSALRLPRLRHHGGGRPPARRRRPARPRSPRASTASGWPWSSACCSPRRWPSPPTRWSRVRRRPAADAVRARPTCGSRCSACPRCSSCSPRPACCAACRTPAPRWWSPSSARWPTSCSTCVLVYGLGHGHRRLGARHRARPGRDGGRVRGRRRARRRAARAPRCGPTCRASGLPAAPASRWSCAP